VYVTHDQAEAMALGDRIAVMANGRIAQIGTPQDIYFAPADAFVADFIGTMNRVRGAVSDGKLRFAGGHVPLANGHSGEQVMFRPEDLRLVDQAAAQFSGRVVSSFFLGDHTRLVIDAGAEPMLIARVQQRSRFQPGDVVHCAVDPQAVMALHPGNA
jgi:putative spermidine/putrescine transport system ATP-binding protein